MNNFLQMDVFFFISSLVAVVFLALVIVAGVYVFLFIRRVHKLIADVQSLVHLATSESKDVLNLVVDRIDSILSNIGIVEKTAITIVSTILAKKIKKRVKIKREAPKK